MNNHEIEEFRAYDPKISFIAAHAAAEVDSFIIQGTSSFENISKLSKLLNDASENTRTRNISGNHLSIMDPMSTSIFKRAYQESHHSNLRSFEELNDRAKNLANEFNELIKNGKLVDNALLAKLRDFCIALSKHSLSCRREYSSDMNTPPFKL